jgi:hypothetical protein
LGRRGYGDHLLGDLVILGSAGAVDGAELLVAVPDKVDFPVRVAELQTPGELGLLAFRQVLDAVTQDPANLIARNWGFFDSFQDHSLSAEVCSD